MSLNKEPGVCISKVRAVYIYKIILSLIILFSVSLFAGDIFTGQKSKQKTSEPLVFSILHKSNFVSAAEHGDFKIVSEYITLGMSPDATDYNLHTALMGATLNGHTKIIKLLLSKGASVDQKNKYHMNAIDYAVIQERQEMIPFLENHKSIIIRNLSSTGNL